MALVPIRLPTTVLPVVPCMSMPSPWLALMTVSKLASGRANHVPAGAGADIDARAAVSDVSWPPVTLVPIKLLFTVMPCAWPSMATPLLPLDGNRILRDDVKGGLRSADDVAMGRAVDFDTVVDVPHRTMKPDGVQAQ